MLVNLIWLFGPEMSEHILSNGHIAGLFGGVLVGGTIQNIALWLVWRIALRVNEKHSVRGATGLIWRVPIALTASAVLYLSTSLVTAIIAIEGFSWFRLSITECGDQFVAWFQKFLQWRPDIGNISNDVSSLPLGGLVEGYRIIFVLNVAVLLFLTVTGKRTALRPAVQELSVDNKDQRHPP